ncbi:mitochondrial carrier [Cystobasidium minutum MCA 4210]|uniref:mitochondrial carrier n=1 Tax=Cystobasidium minutum MCA 4210 TaxID=1397322 RepID=UPI0034CDBDF6|eukprot:jgi/Rhomi1/43881/CE43880_1536
MSSAADKVPPAVEALSGSIGASLANVIVYPLDLVAARIQTKTPLRRSKHEDPKTGGGAHHKKDDYADTLTALRTIYRTNNHSLSGFYQGIASDTLSTALSQFLYFYMFAALLRIFNKQVTKAIDNGNNGKDAKGAIAVAGKAAVKLSAAKELLIGSIAGILSRGVTTPLSTITVRKQTAAKAKVQPQDQHAGKSSEVEEEDEDDDDDYSPDSSIAIAKDIYQEHGLSGFWRGYGSACALTINPAITFFLIAAFKGIFIPRRYRDKPTQLQTFFISAFASSIASALCYPLILTKTRLQWKSPTGRLLYRNMADVIVKTVKRSGIRGLYAGLQTQIMKGFISQGVTMVVKQRIELLIVYLYRQLYRLRQRSIQ